MDKLIQPCVCAQCLIVFDRGYRMSKSRQNRPQYCSAICLKEAHAEIAQKNLRNRFWSKVTKGEQEDCWEWVGRRNPTHYGVFDVGNKPRLAHRISYQLLNGDFDSELNVCHACDNPPCVNPGHLFLGTDQENMADCIQKGRFKYVPVRCGVDHHASKLTPPQALRIYNSTETAQVLAKRYGISSTAVRYIWSGTNWRHLTGGARG